MTIAAGFALPYDAFDEERGELRALAGRTDSQTGRLTRVVRRGHVE